MSRSDYRDRLVERTLWIPAAIARRYASPPRLPFEDLEQIGREELVHTATEWNGNGTFELMAWTRVRRAVVDEFRRELGRDGQRAIPTVQMTANMEPRGDGGFSEARFTSELFACRDRLSPAAWRTLVAVAVGVSQAEVARADGVTEGAVTLRMRRARAAFSEARA